MNTILLWCHAASDGKPAQLNGLFSDVTKEGYWPDDNPVVLCSAFSQPGMSYLSGIRELTEPRILDIIVELLCSTTPMA